MGEALACPRAEAPDYPAGVAPFGYHGALATLAPPFAFHLRRQESHNHAFEQTGENAGRSTYR